MADPHLDVVDNPIERLELLAGDEEAIASFLDQIDVTALPTARCWASSPARRR